MLRALVMALIVMPGAALGLSCVKPNMGEDFNRIAEAPELYWIAYGTLRQTGPRTEVAEGQPFSVPYEFEGRINFGRDMRTEKLTLKATCLSAWCGGQPSENTPVFMYLEHQDDGLVLNSGPCGGDFVDAPSLGQLGALRACLKNGRCEEAEINAFE